MNDKKLAAESRLGAVSVPAEIAIYIVVGLVALCCIIPFVFVVIISFSADSSIREIGYSFLPNELSLQAYKFALDLGRQLWISFFNSVFTTIIGTACSVMICILYSYALFRKDFKFRTFFTFFSFFTMIFGGGLAPTYIVCSQLLGLSNNYFALIVPLLVNPFNFIIMRTFFQSSVPEALIEAASIDGSGEYYTLFKIILPISLPGIATVSLLNVLAFWNEWFLSLLYITEAKYYPLQYLLIEIQRKMEFLVQNGGLAGVEAQKALANMPKDSLRMALCVIIVIPVACAYPFFQRFIISGLTIGSVKG